MAVRIDEVIVTLRASCKGIVWSDLFHEAVPADFITKAFKVMEHCAYHRFIVCTKRPERIQSVLYDPEGNYFLGGGDYIPNVILMTTVENQEMADKRIPELLRNEPFKLALSVEPMLEPLDLKLNERWCDNTATDHACDLKKDLLNWVVIGCESGRKRRPMDIEWARGTW